MSVLSWISKRQSHRGFILIAGLAVGIGLWALFRPEKLFLNDRVNEPVPEAVDLIQPMLVGSLYVAAGQAEITGRVSVLKSESGGLRLEITNFRSQAGQSFTVALVAPDAGNQRVLLGVVTVNHPEALSIPSGFDPGKQMEVILLDDSMRSVAKATLEAF